MADYKELLRRAISALPENNGAARRAVYEKARSALVGQLRAIQPPLPARDITQHRLQLEDCIRQVEQEASEAVINLGREPQNVRPAMTPPVQAPKPPPSPREEPAPEPVAAPLEASEPPASMAAPEESPAPEADEPEPQAEEAAPAPADPEPEPEAPAAQKSIEDIIAEAAETSGAAISLVANKDTAPEPVPTRSGFFTPRRDPFLARPDDKPAILPGAPVVEPVLGSTALAHQPAAEPVIIEPPLSVEPALSSVREVDLEGSETREAEGAIERAIETLDREARGEPAEPLPPMPPPPASLADGMDRPDESGFAAAEAETRSGAGLTIFLVVFALLLVGVGGAGFWAWREGYVDLDQMFGQNQPAITETAQNADQPALPTLDANPTGDSEGAAGPGNTATNNASEPTSALEGVAEDRLEPTPEPVTPTGGESILPSIGTGENKTEERLSGSDTSIANANDPAASVDPVNLAGNQSLLLEASGDGQSGAVPFSGTVDWTEGVDEIGLPTLQARASIPARNLEVSITIRKNSDPILPASHLMEISFDVPDTFMGGSIATLAGVLLKNEELVPGTALSGAAARVVGNSFLFALSASPNDVAANSDLLRSRRWIDLAVIYGTGRNAILTLEKDEDAQVLFDRALAAWAE
ncbi:hypothetical protein [Devosia elaeis]|uniref:CheA signal transduction histidine kinase n=1 Tax=Devosia elaeis TaxID=1770058 RepID=A0A178HJX7_9HYPH|nr:hypothetical protein [Devosia elaeis]OAM73141.1 hypothetical protein A3840_18515 [Devosia elaeis]